MTCARRPAGARTPASPTSAGSRRPEPRSGRTRARRLTLLLPVLALLAGAFSLFAPASAQAQTTPVWSASLVPQYSSSYFPVTGAVGNYGCANGNVASDRCTDTSVLDDDDFTYGTPSATYTITELGLALISNADNKFFLRFSGLTGTAAKTALAGLTLNVAGNAFIINDGTASGNLLTWTTSLVWSGSTGNVQVSLAQSTTADIPAAPTNLGVAAGNAQLGLTWTAPPGTVTGYDVHYTSAAASSVTNTAAASGNNAATAWVAVTRTGATASQTISSLTNNTSYRVRVRAKNSLGNSAWVFGSGTPAAPAAGTPAAPTGLGVEPRDAALRLGWTAPSGTLTGYDVHYTSSTTVADNAAASGSDASAAWVADTGTITGSRTTWTIRELTNGTPYRVRLRAKNSTGAGAWAFGTGTPNVVLSWPNANYTSYEGDTFGPTPRLQQSQVTAAISGTLTYAAGTTNPASLSDDLTTGYATTFSVSEDDYPIPSVAVPVDDTVNEEHETFTVTINAGTGYIVGTRATTTVTIIDNDPPAAPSGLSLTAGSGKLSASWTKPAGPVTGYQLRHKQTTATNQAATTPGDPSTGWVTSTASITTTSAEITGLTNGTAYHVQVRATDGQTQTGNGYGAWSASQSGTPAVPTLAAPTGLSVTAGNAQLALTWTAPSGTVTGYDVHYTSAASGTVANSAAATGNDPSAAWVAVTRTGATASQTISSLSNGTAYRVRVRAKNSDTSSAWVFGTGTPASSSPPAAPTSLSVSPSDAQLSLTWTAPSGTLTGYDVHYTSAASGTVSNSAAASGNNAAAAWVAVSRTETSPPTASQAISSLANGTAYRVRVRAKNANGAGPWAFGTGTPDKSVVAFDSATISKAEDLGSYNADINAVPNLAAASSVNITVDAASTAGSAEYTVTSPTSLIAGATQAGLASLTWTDDTVNEPHETVIMHLEAITSAPYTLGTQKTLTFTITDNDPPAAPSGLSLTAGSGKLSASWTKPAGPVTGYQLRHKQTTAADQAASTPGDPSTGWVTSTSSITTTSAEITGLTNGTAYHVQVRATDGQTQTGNGWGAWSASQSGTPAVPLPAAPTNLVVDALSAQLNLSWTAPSGTLTGYDVHYTSAASGTVTDSAAASGNNASAAWVADPRGAETSPPTASEPILSLTNGTAYRVRVRAKNSAGAGPWVFGTGTPVAVVPPGVPRTVTIAPGNNAVTLSWQAPASWGDWSADDFEIREFVTDASGGAWFIRSPGTTSTTIQRGARGTGHYASNGQTETWKIRASSQKPGSDGSTAAHFSKSAWVTVTVTVGVPGVPSGLRATAGAAKLDLRWTAPAQNGGAITGYDVHYTSAASGTVTNSAAASGSDPSAAWVDASHSGTVSTQTISSLANDGTQYRWRVRAKNSIGAGGWAFGTGRTLVGVSLSANPNPVTEGADVTVTATLVASGSAVTIPVTVSTDGSNTAEAGDVGALTGIAVAAGQTTGTGTVGTNDDADTLDETFTVALNTAAMPSGYLATGTTSVQVTITDNNMPKVSLSASPDPVTEGSDVTVTATLSSPISNAVTIPVTISTDGANTAEAGDVGTLASITIAAEATSGTGTIATNQDTDTLDETFTVSLGTLPSAVTEGSPASVEVTIDDDDMPTVSLSASPEPVPEGSSVTVTATLSSPISGEVTIPVTLADVTAEAGDRGTLASITIAAEATSGTGAIAANHDADTLDETFTVSLGTLPTEVTAGSPSSVTVTIDDDDMPTVSLSVDQDRPTEGESVTLTVTLSSPISGAVAIPLTVDLGTAEAGDITVPATITIAAEATTGTGTLATHHDAGHLDETFTVSLGSTLPTAVLAGSPASVTVTIVDDEGNIRVSFARSTMTLCEGGPKQYLPEYVLSRNPDTNYSPIRLIGDRGTAEHRDHDWHYSAWVNIRSIGLSWVARPYAIRALPDADKAFEQFTVKFDRNNMAEGFVPDPDKPTEVTVTIIDDDLWGQDGCNIQPPRLSVKGDVGVEWSGGGWIDFTVSIDRDNREPFTVDYRTEDVTAVGGQDYTAKTGTLSFGPYQRSQEVRVHILDDDVEDSGERFKLVLYNPQGAVIEPEKGVGIGTILNKEAYGAAVQLTATFERAPARHEGPAFWFDVRFKEALGETANAPSAASFTVRNGRLDRVWKVEDGLWRLLVSPETRHDVTVTLKGGLACDAAGAVCAADGRALSNSPTVTVAGPDGALSSDTALSALTVEGAPGAAGTWTALGIGTFAAGTTAYSATVPHGTTHVRVTATAADADATLKAGKGSSLTAVKSGSASGAIALSVGANALEVEVTAEDGTKKTYTVTVTREAQPLSADADLSALSVEGAPGPNGSWTALDVGTFAAGTTAYSATVLYETTHVRLTATAAHARAVLKAGAGSSLTAAASGTAGAALPLAVGANALAVEVTAENGTAKTYTVTVTREERVLSSNATLAGLTAEAKTEDGWSALGLGGFAAGTTAYSAKVPNGTTHIRLTATVADAAATLKAGAGLSLAAVTSGAAGAALPLSVGSNALAVRVTAEDGTVKTYAVTVEREAPPLTARLRGTVSEHDGETPFMLELELSESLDSGSRWPSAASFEVKAGSVESVRRFRPYRFHVHVRPKSWKDVTVTLAGGRGCDEAGAICTADGRSVSNTSTLTVGGPVRIRIEGARAREGKDESLDFAVTLNRAAAHEVSVDYETADETATAGADYTATSGTLTFAAGETAKTVSVPVLDDAIDEGREVMRLLLSNPRGAYLRNVHRRARGIITNDDALQQAWLSRFGRTVGGHVTDAVSGRLVDGLTPGAHATVAGQAVDLTRTEDGKALADLLAGLGQRFGAQAPANDEDPFSRSGLGGGADSPASALSPSTRVAASSPAQTMTGRELLLGSAFHLAGDGDGAGPGLAAWGRAAQGRFDGEADSDTGRLGLDGEVLTGTLGADADFGRMLAGVAVSLSEGDGTFDDSGATTGAKGTVESTMTTVSPYARLDLTERVSAWGLGGWGTGAMTLRFDDGTAPVRTDLSMRLGALGARGALLEQDRSGGMDLALKADAFFVTTESDKAASSAATTADASRLRLVLEGGRSFDAGGGATVRPSLELGVRHDGGDAETGSGLELGGGVAFTDPSTGLGLEAKARMLLAHADSDYEEWGASATARLDPGAHGRGLSFSLAPSIGATSSASERLWGAQDARALAPDGGAFEAGRGLQAEAGYGMALFGDRFTGTPNLGFGLADGGARDWRLGWRLTSAVEGDPGFEVSLDAIRREAANDNDAEHGVMLRGAVRW